MRWTKEELLKTTNNLYRLDPWINELFNAASLSVGDIERTLDQIYDNEFFDTLDDNAVALYEYFLSITPKKGQSIDSRRSVIRSRWVSSDKATLQLLQVVADSWKNATIKLEFINGRIHVKFISPIGIPTDLDSLKEALENVKPAHLAIFYTFAYLTWSDAYKITWQQSKQKTWRQMRQEDA